VDKQFIEFIHEGKQPFLTHLCTQGRVANQVGKQHRHQLALTSQPPAIGQDFIGQVRREVALEVIELLVERRWVAGCGGLPCRALRRVKMRCKLWPQALQNRAAGRFGLSQAGQRVSNGCPHWSQNLARSSLVW